MYTLEFGRSPHCDPYRISLLHTAFSLWFLTLTRGVAVSGSFINTVNILTSPVQPNTLSLPPPPPHTYTPPPPTFAGQDGVSSSRLTAEQDHSSSSPHSPRLHPSHHPHQQPDNPPPKPPRTNRPAYQTAMKESPILPDRNPIHQQQAKKQNRKLIHHWVQEHQLR